MSNSGDTDNTDPAPVTSQPPTQPDTTQTNTSQTDEEQTHPPTDSEEPSEGAGVVAENTD